MSNEWVRVPLSPIRAYLDTGVLVGAGLPGGVYGDQCQERHQVSIYSPECYIYWGGVVVIIR